MKALKDILYKVPLISSSGNMETAVANLAFDSRKVQDGTAFIAVKGVQADGHDFIAEAVKKGAKSVVCEVLPQDRSEEVAYIVVKNSTEAMGIMAANYYEHPSKQLALVGITGTNGKTTTVTLLHQLFRKLGYQVGLLSTVENKINDKVIPATHTTPDAITLNELLQEMLNKGCTHCFMEVSSHAIVQNRVAGISFKGAVFSNISHDHLDYHASFDEYIKAKKLLFDGLPDSAFALVNIDDKRGNVMLQNTKAAKHTYALNMMADFKGKVVSNTMQGLELEIDNLQVWFKLIGDFNAYNLLAAYGVAMLLEEKQDEVLTQLSSLQAAAGRFEQVLPELGIMAIVDYAHTPDALENVLKTIGNVRQGNEQIITVVGCGGNRDKTKRPLMASIAAKLSDKVILTSDNPRSEAPLSIIKDMEEGIATTQSKKVLSITDRKEAIKTACSLAKKGDIILVAGKGHETYQEVNGIKHDFDDKKILMEMLQLMHS